MLRRLPRPCRLGAIATFCRNELGVFQRFPNDTTKRLSESARVIVFTLVKPERLFVQISEQMKRLHVHIGSMQRPFEKRPKVFQSVRVDVTLCVANGMVDNSAVVIAFKIIIRHKRVGADRRALLDMCARTFPQSSGLRVLSTIFKTTWECLSGVVRSKIPCTAVFLSPACPTPVRLSLCIYRALAPM